MKCYVRAWVEKKNSTKETRKSNRDEWDSFKYSYLLPSLVDGDVLVSGDVNAEVPLVRVLVLRPRDGGGDAGDAEGEGDEEECRSLGLMR